MKAVFLDLETFSENVNLASISQQVDTLTCYAVTEKKDILARCQHADILITNKVILDESILSQLPNVKLICVAATGFNNIDLNAAKKAGIAVTNVNGYAGNSVSQYVFSQLLHYYQNIAHHNQNTEKGLWPKNKTFCLHGNTINELAGKTLGIIGYGHLGRSIEKIAVAFDMNVMVSERKNAKVIRDNRFALEDVLANSDVISLHCPQTKETENIINDESLSLMKSNAVLVNTARGALIDSSALITALRENKIAYAILDVLITEPPPLNDPLLNCQLENLKITGHIAWASKQAQQRLLDLIANNILAYKEGKRTNRLD